MPRSVGENVKNDGTQKMEHDQEEHIEKEKEKSHFS